MSAISTAVNRFGIGARPDQTMPNDPRRWLVDQFARYDPRPTPIATVANSAVVAGELTDYQREERMLRQGHGRVRPPVAPVTDAPVSAPTVAGAPQTLPGEQRAPAKIDRSEAERLARKIAGTEARQTYAEAVAARATVAFTTDAPFVERLVWFWANHFAVSIDKLQVVGLAGTLEFEAIRPHVLGRFSDMLFAVEHHPAMLLYLDQAVSVGPKSLLGEANYRRGNRRLGLNENLAREILELHTLGVRTGYTQADVTEFARALTGWTVEGIGGGPLGRVLEGYGTPGRFVFAEPMHEPGARTIMGKRYPDHGVRQAQAVLDDCAASPATAQHIATKLARHFAGDDPPPAMVARLAQAFLDSGGDLPTVYAAIVNSPEAWAENPAKFKTPWEWSVSAYRALGTRQVQPAVIVGLLNQLSQPVWKPGQPVGYDDTAASWAGPDAVLRRVEVAERFASRAPATIDAGALAPKLFPDTLSAATAQSLQRAESPAQALALLLVAPEMMRR